MEKGELDSGRVWFIQSEGQVTFGLTDLAISQLGEVTNIESSELDESVRREDIIFSIEGTKQNYEFMSPVDGVVSETNESMIDDPSTISEDPADTGWVLRLEISGGQLVPDDPPEEPQMSVTGTKKPRTLKSKSKSKTKSKTRKMGKNESKKRKKK